MSHRFEDIAQRWVEREKLKEEMFEDFMEREGWREYKLNTDNSNMNFNNISSACQKCIFNQIQKYSDYKSADGSSYSNQFNVPCTGIPKEYISQDILHFLKLTKDSPEAKEMLAARDPVEWAKQNCLTEQGTTWIPRWYQNVILSCSSKRAVYRMGRRTGKSIRENTMILTPYGIKKIADIEKGDLVYAYNTKTDKVEPVPVVAKHDHGVQEVWELKNNTKVYAECTKDHRWYCSHEARRDKPKMMHTDELTRRYGIKRKFVDIPFGEKDVKDAYYIGVSQLYIFSNNLLHDIEELFTWNRESILKFLAGLFHSPRMGADIEPVSVNDGKLKLTWFCYTSKLRDTIQNILFSLTQEKPDIDYKIDFRGNTRFSISLDCNSINKKLLKAISPYVFNLSNKWKEEYEDLIEEDLNYLHVEFGKSEMAQTYDLEIATEDHLYLTAHGLVTHNSDALAVLALFYCFTQPFYARDPNDGSVLINPKTGQAMQQKTKVLCITPRQTHADNLMNKVYGFIDRNPLLKSSVMSSKRSPYYILQFNNGSRITTLTAGSGTASSGVNIRSFDADIIIMDEGNYLGEAELEATKAILMTNVNTMLRISSTPRGLQDFFWEMCYTKPEYKEFHFPSVALPHWEMTKKNVYADVSTEDEFLHEYMAEFSASSEGVFRIDLVQAAMSDFNYSQSTRKPECIYGIGVDWNTHAGTEIFVIEADEATGVYRGAYAYNVPKSEWTQLNALEKLIDLIRYWRPSVICVDEGHGHGAIEVLKKYSLEHGTNDNVAFAIRDNLIVYNFSSKIEVADPVTGRIIKKWAKPFLVENTVRRFEEGKIQISSSDTLLRQQLSHYEVISITEQGVPKYKCTKAGLGDHRLDAFMLSLVGIKLKFGHLDKRSMSISDTGYIGKRSVDVSSREIPLGRNEFEQKLLSSTEYISYENVPRNNNDSSKYKNLPSRTSFIKDPKGRSRNLKGLKESKPLYRQSNRRSR